jgi:hypothetical protein
MAFYLRSRATAHGETLDRDIGIRHVTSLLRRELTRLSIVKADYRMAVPVWYPGCAYHKGEILRCKELNAFIKLRRDYDGDTPPREGEYEILVAVE